MSSIFKKNDLHSTVGDDKMNKVDLKKILVDELKPLKKLNKKLVKEQVSEFPSGTVQSVIAAIINMTLTGALNDMADELARTHELDALDVQLRLHRYLMDENAVNEAAASVTSLVKTAREAAPEPEE